MARLRIDVLNGDSKGKKDDNWAKPAENMLLVKEDAYDYIFKENKLPSDTNALVWTLVSTYDSQTSRYNYSYSFSLSALFTDMLRREKSDTLRMLLVPIETEYTTSNTGSYLSSVKMRQSISATKIRSSKNSQSPMKVEVVYSGFNTKEVR